MVESRHRAPASTVAGSGAAGSVVHAGGSRRALGHHSSVLASARLRRNGPGMEALEIQRVRGMNDALPPDESRLRTLTTALRDHFERFGYRGVDTPIVENLDLFLRKSG